MCKETYFGRKHFPFHVWYRTFPAFRVKQASKRKEKKNPLRLAGNRGVTNLWANEVLISHLENVNVAKTSHHVKLVYIITPLNTIQVKDIQ